MRNADLERLEEQERRVRTAIGAAAHEYGVTATAERVWAIDPVAFDDRLVSRAREALAGSDDGERLVSGPLHDAAACARAGVPTAMMFVRSLGGVSHSREEDSSEDDLVIAIDALVNLVVELVDEGP
jgi:N-carbamoyl-L-amino-acid hydrolase